MLCKVTLGVFKGSSKLNVLLLLLLNVICLASAATERNVTLVD